MSVNICLILFHMWITSFGIPLFTVAQPSVNITKIDTLVDDRLACPESTVYFICRTYEADTIAWSSDQYIGEHGIELSFAARAAGVGSIFNSPTIPSTVANLTVNDLQNRVLESILRISVKLSNSSHRYSVTCRDTGNNISNTISFTVPADPGMPRELLAVQFKHLMEMCIVTALWRRPENGVASRVEGYMLFANDTVVSNQTVEIITTTNETRISSLFPVSDCAAHMVTVMAINRCGRVGQRSSSLTLDPDQSLTIPGTCSPTNGVIRNDKRLLTTVTVFNMLITIVMITS